MRSGRPPRAPEKIRGREKRRSAGGQVTTHPQQVESEWSLDLRRKKKSVRLKNEGSGGPACEDLKVVWLEEEEEREGELGMETEIRKQVEGKKISQVRVAKKKRV